MLKRFLAVSFFLTGLSGANAQFQLLPDNPPPPVAPKPAAKAPRPQIEPATKGDFPQRLRREEMEPLFFNNKPFAARGLGRSINFTVVLYTNGAAERTDLNTNEKETGTWRWLGDGYCSKWGKSLEGCFSIVKDGDIYKIVRGTRAIAFWSTPPEGAQAMPPPELEKPEPSAKKKKTKKN